MPQVFRPAATTIARVVMIALLVGPFVFVGVACGLMHSSYITRQSIVIPQPVPFSHKHHVGEIGLDCRYCHTAVETSTTASVPPTRTCMTCHSQLFTHAAMLAPVRTSLATNTPIHWKRVHRLPDYVYFDHSVHIANGIGCSSCHGDVSTMPLMRQTQPLTMSWCLSCHRDPKPHLRPASEIFDPNWTPPPDQKERGRKLMARYLIHTKHLTDCSTCHR